jgi:PAS domain S-box-containing protein
MDEEISSTGLTRLEWLPVAMLFLTICILALLHIDAIWLPPGLFPALNITFLSIVSLVVAALAARSYVVRKSVGVLLLGCGVLTLGLGSMIAGLSLQWLGPYATVAIYNTSLCLAGLCHLGSALISLTPKPRRMKSGWPLLLACYSIAFALIVLLLLLVRLRIWPVHFIQGSGVTVFGALVEYVAFTLFALSAILFMRITMRKENSFFRLYGLGLASIAVGVTGNLLQKSIGDPVNWVARLSQYLGGVYMLIAVLSLIRKSGDWLLPWEKALRETEEKYRLIVENASEGIWIADRESITTFVNRRMADMLGFTVDEMIGTSALQYVDRGHIDAIELNLVKRRRGEKSRSEFTFIRKDGAPVWVVSHSTPLLDNSGSFMGTLAIISDITERRQMQEALIEERDKLRALIENMNEEVWFCDVHGKVNLMNRAARENLGLEKEEATELHLESLSSMLEIYDSPGHLRTPEDAPVARSLRGEVVRGEEMIRNQRTGAMIHREFSSVPIKDAEGTIVGVVGVFRDIGARKEMEKRLMENAQELQRSNKELEQFAYMASHDLREPLRKISAFADRLRIHCGGQLDEKGLDYLGRMENAAHRMKQLIEGLLDLSRVTLREITFEKVNMSRIVNDVRSDLEVRIHETGAIIEAGDLPLIKADPLQMRQLFQNLISNSLKFCNGSPRIEIKSRSLDDGNYEITIEDNGIGFSEDFLDILFKPCQQLNPRNKYEGIGMGLAICQRIVARHNGAITAKSTPGQGATFIITLPAIEKMG